MLFSLSVGLYRKSYCATPYVCGCSDVSVSKELKFTVNLFYAMGQGLSGELSCMQVGLVQSTIMRLCKFRARLIKTNYVVS